MSGSDAVPDLNGNRCLDWGINAVRRGSVSPKGKAGRCITCGGFAVVRNPDGDPQHKVCAEIEAGLREAEK